MKGTISVKRDGKWVTFSGEYEATTPVTVILSELNSRDPLLDVKGREVEPIEWECSCGQKVCGACAMVINGTPRLACSTFFGEAGPDIRLEPLSKFPLIADLKVDRTQMYDSLSEMKLWLDEGVDAKVRNIDLQYASASCMLCGCCLEICPNYTGRGKFFGAAGMNACFRIADQLDGAARRARLKEFARHGDSGCSKSLSCGQVCPQNIPLAVLISRMNRDRIISMFIRD